MNYWRLSNNDVKEFCDLIELDTSNGTSAAAKAFCEKKAESVTTPGSINNHFPDLSTLEKLSKEINQYLSDPKTASAGPKEHEQYEGELCAKTHQALKDMPIEILDDPKFWQYLAVNYFSVFIIWRESKALGKGNIMTYFKAASSALGKYSIPLRLYLRGQAIFEATNEYDLAAAIPESTDFWRSHILKVQTGRARQITGAFAEMQRDNRMVTEQLRRLASIINKMWANVYLYEYDSKSSKTFLKECRKRSETESH